jgi:hypothetical protein
MKHSQGDAAEWFEEKIENKPLKVRFVDSLIDPVIQQI